MNLLVSTSTGSAPHHRDSAPDWTLIVAGTSVHPTAGYPRPYVPLPEIALLPPIEDEDAAFERACRERLGQQLRQES